MVLIFAGAARPITDPDFWWHLRTGKYILETRSIPHTDMFSSVKFGSEWVTHEWLSEIVMYSIYRVSSYSGLIAFFSAIVATCFWITYKRCELRAPNPYVAGLALIIGAGATIPTWGVRPQMFSMVFAAAFLWVLDEYAIKKNIRLIWGLIPATILWVNMHAGFPVGLVLMLVTIVGLALDGYILQKLSAGKIWESTRRLFFVWILCVGAVAINPNGARLFSYPLETLRSRSMMQYIQEWRSPDFQDPMFLGLIVFMMVTFCVLAVSGKRALPSELLMLSATLAGTLRSGRNVPFFALVATPILARHLWTRLAPHVTATGSVLRDRRDNGIEQGNVVISVLLLVVMPIVAAGVRLRNSVRMQSLVEARDFPRAAVDFINDRNLTQPIYNEYHWGGYLIWQLYPRYRVFMDGRADVYGDELINDFFRMHDGAKDWRKLLDHYSIQSVLVSPNTAIASLLREDKGWTNVFEDRQTVIFERVSVPTAYYSRK